MSLQALTSPELIFPELPGSDRMSVLRALAERMAERGPIRDADRLFQKLFEREELGSTIIGKAVAVPHCKIDGLARGVLAVGISRRGVDFGGDDDAPVKVFFALVSPTRSPAEHLRGLAAISRWVKADSHVKKVLKLRSAEKVWELLGEGEE